MRKGKHIVVAVGMFLLFNAGMAPCQEPFFDDFTVSVCTDSLVLIGMQSYDLIQNAYDSITPGTTETIYIQAMEFGENLILDRDVTITLKGGYNCFFDDPPDSFTTVRSMTISNGTVIAENIILSDGTGAQLYSILPDTGQQTSLTDTFGEDHDYTINPPAYTLNGNGTTTDNVTGLMWQSSDDDIFYNWYEASGTPDVDYNPSGAVNVCGELNLAGFNDWRLPSENELQGIINYDLNAPAIDLTYFPDTTSNG